VASRNGRTDRVSVSFVCRGHPNISATHDKTVELTRDVDISRRATCVVGVASTHDDRALLDLRGQVQVTLECEDAHDTFLATISPFFLGDASLVFRKGVGLRGRTIAYEASKTAANIDRALVARLAAPETELRVTIDTVRSAPTSGVLFVVSLPIGNDGDIGRRAIDVLERVDLVLAEDTRRLRALAQRVGFRAARSTSYHDHNETDRAEEVLERLRRGGRIALVSDAGTPLCSDPGYVVVSRAVAEGIAVSPVPGPSAALAAITASGLPVDRFVFGGFLPRRSSQRQPVVRALTALGTAVVFYEAGSRVAQTLADIATVCPDWRVCFAREMTKTFEDFRYGNASVVAQQLGDAKVLGECTIVVAPPVDVETAYDTAYPDTVIDDVLRSLLAHGVAPSTLAQALRVVPGVGRNQAYERVLALGRENPRP
jgi:16S rRNA (cytidine1402-2'-O)-methyltransferase